MLEVHKNISCLLKLNGMVKHVRFNVDLRKINHCLMDILVNHEHPPENAQWQGISAVSLRAEEMTEHEKRSAKESLKTES